MAARPFGPFVFDTATGSLTKHGTAVRLQPQPARVLALLVERAGQLVTRDELKQAVWSDGTHVDFDFDNETADSAYEGIAGGIADETVSRLSTPERLARVDVIGNAAILREPRTFRDLRKVGRNLGAQYVLLAQLKRDDKGVRVIAHLIRVSDEAHVWAQTFDRADFSLATQSEIAEAIAAAVSARL